MTVQRANVSIATGVAFIALLAGCVAPTVAAHRHPHTQTPTPTPATTAAVPGSRVPLKCGDLFSPTDIAGLVGAPVTVSLDETSPPASLDDVADAQLGVLGCEWIGGDASEEGYSATVRLDIAPDSRSGFEANFSTDLANRPTDAASSVLSSAGDKSGYWCAANGVSSGTPDCWAQMLVGSYWVSVVLSAVAPATEALASANTQKVLESVASKLRTAGSPKPRWKSPASTPPKFCAEANATSKVRKIFAAPGLTVFPVGKRSFDASSIALDGSLAECDWIDPQTQDNSGAVDIELLAGGAWVFPGFAPKPAVDGIVTSYAPVVIPGASSALMGCDGGGCEAYLAFGTTAAEIDFVDSGTSKNIAALSALISAIEAS